MKTKTIRTTIALMLSFTSALITGVAQHGKSDDLRGTSWQLVRFQGNDGSMEVPAGERSKYTITFAAGRATVRVDCNRGTGTWKYKGPNQIQFGSMDMTRAKCGASSLHDRIVKDGAVIRNYVIKDGKLFLSLLEEAGTYELERLGRSPSMRSR